MRLIQIDKITGTLELVTGLHIGASNAEMHIGGTDNPVVVHPLTREPYIPGSSLKGKIRSLLEWELGAVAITRGNPFGFAHLAELPTERRIQGKRLLQLFGGAPESGGTNADLVQKIGPTRLSFWDCSLDEAWVTTMKERALPLTEVKTENMIDRIEGVAKHPRNTERVPAGARFQFTLTMRQHEGDDALLPMLWRGLALLELTGLGGSGSRGYGKVRFRELRRGDEDCLAQLASASVLVA
ncbi:type III-A CRISPR-associated RAMP protein Csm3 [Acidithiobacillus caldus]|jgi:CRISPR-associated protein Csm3|uniref:CRISPR system Cms endoribonuclease Csm3 n=1 Tax=Acidithiobacillus caldus TaxID=33059 RepID=A0A1E7YNR4_9PROT|nr:type III-A CRISPR-associated RAMP protein Csm3 [Acidithiobacillus caldus]OFC30695.1 type III-A CRISPR-associated RAMP protein Csm3 [Acidithiobacillus caldus]OFC36783.1 type III-A CRISPR-associated RAMP protein Csm3 [Acidithiobacillus caldus]OFC37982.1 type III-A CRISPR-associated RAMP protein Csm3 [Acidithiobacillus caldus]